MSPFAYDAFISHAVEDKLSIANELCARLEQQGLKIWYSGYELRPGDRITQRIEEGLHTSRYGVVIFTPTFVSKVWALREFFALLELEKLGKKKILPILHGITARELAARGLEVEDRFMISTDRGLDYVVDRLAQQIRQPSLTLAPRRRYAVTGAIAVAVVLLLGFYAWHWGGRIPKEPEFVEQHRTIRMSSPPSDDGRRRLVIQTSGTPDDPAQLSRSLGTAFPGLTELINREDVTVTHYTTITFDDDSADPMIRALVLLHGAFPGTGRVMNVPEEDWSKQAVGGSLSSGSAQHLSVRFTVPDREAATVRPR